MSQMLSKENEALRRIRRIIARCLNEDKKPTKDEMFSILNWCSSGLNDWLPGRGAADEKERIQ